MDDSDRVRPQPSTCAEVDDTDAPPPTTSPSWSCPICNAAVARPHRPGRARVYCTNACRQRAYRWRCRHRERLVTPPRPQRAHTPGRTHALRADADFVTPLADARGRRVTACGTFARAARDAPARRYRHRWFYACTESDRHTGAVTTPDTTCRRCVDLLGVARRPIGDVLAEIDREAEYSRHERQS
ncbi:MAG: hypothetical protein HKN44_08595 [Ilumatobacter sp.]|nr:hypothetical protein [Ilumatobacter sp.]